MACTWLKSRRERVRGLSQEALAKALGEDVRAIRRWERCEPEAKKDVPYAELASELGVSVIQLCDDHLGDLEEAGLDVHAQHTRRALAEARRQLRFPPVDPTPIRAALEACAATGLSQAIAERAPSLSDAQRQAKQMAAWLDSDKLDDLFDALNAPLEGAIKRAAGDQDRLVALWRFLIVIAQSSTALDADLKAGGLYQGYGEDKAWPYRALIDQAKQLKGMRTVRPHPKNPRYQLDDGRDSTRVVKSGDVTQSSVDGRVHELVREIAATLALDDPTPRVTDTNAFEDHCRLVNAALAVENATDSHVFGLWGRGNQESEEVKARLMALLDNLRLFDCRDSGGENGVLRVHRETLEAWYARYLNGLMERGLSPETPPTATHPEPSSEKETQTMQPNPHPQIIINNSAQNGSGNTANQAGHDINQIRGDMPVPEQLALLLDQILGDTSTRKPETKELRQAAREAQGELEGTGTLSEKARRCLRRAAEALPAADKLATIGNKLADLFDKLPGPGA